jgi:hypothetical protein
MRYLKLNNDTLYSRQKRYGKCIKNCLNCCMDFIHISVFKNLFIIRQCPVNMTILIPKSKGPSQDPRHKISIHFKNGSNNFEISVIYGYHLLKRNFMSDIFRRKIYDV